jgi:hypothetical protein
MPSAGPLISVAPPPTRAAAGWLLGAVLLSTAWVQSAVLTGGFYADDFLWLYRLQVLPWFEFVGKTHGGHLQIARNLVYWFCYQVFGLEPAGYFWLALITHLLNVSLLFAVILRLSRRPLCAALAAALWGLAPINQGSLRWVSVYGHVMAGTFVLLVLVDLTRLAGGDRAPTSWQLARWTLLQLGAATSFGTGLGVAVALPAIAWLLLPRGCGRDRGALVLLAGMAASAALFLAQQEGFPLGGGGHYPLAVFMVLWASLLSYGLASLALGPFFTFSEGHIPFGPLRGLAGEQILPAIHGFGLVLVAVLLLAFAWASPARRRQMVAFAVLAASAYGAIAFGRAPFMVAMNFGMPFMTTTTRYHYLAQLGLAVLLGLAAAGFANAWSRRRLPARLGSVLFGVGLALVLPSYARSARAVDPRLDRRWLHEVQQIMAEVEQTVRAVPPGSPVYVPNHLYTGCILCPREEFPDWAALFVITHREDTLEGRRVYFVEADAELVQRLRKGSNTRIAGLLVTREEALRGASPERP